jgi:hypothetical protein
VATADLCRQHGISEQMLYRWKAKYGGLESGDAKKLKQLEKTAEPRERGRGRGASAVQSTVVHGFRKRLPGGRASDPRPHPGGRHTRECLAIEVDTSLGGMRVRRVLESVIARAPSRGRS